MIMKKIILFTVFLYCAFVQGQNVELLKQANNCDLSTAGNFAEAIANSYRIKYDFLNGRQSNRGNFYTIVYVPATTTEEVRAKFKRYMETDNAYEFECEGCLCVHFAIINEGENKDLEIKGTPKYHFTFVKGKFLDLFNFWVKNVNPNAVDSEVSNKKIDSQRDFKNNQYWYNFAKDDDLGNWYIKNYTERLTQ